MVHLAPYIAGIMLLVVGLGLHIFGMASPNWIDDELNTNRGLFEYCYKDKCFSFFTEPGNMADWTAMKVMSIFAALCGLVSCVLSLIFAFYKWKSPSALEGTVFASLRLKTILCMGASLTAGVAAAFILLTCIICWAKVVPDAQAIAKLKPDHDPGINWKGGYAPKASITGSVMMVIGCGVFLGEAGKVHTHTNFR